MSYHNLMTGDDTRLSILPDSHLTPYKQNNDSRKSFIRRQRAPGEFPMEQAGVGLSRLSGICTAFTWQTVFTNNSLNIFSDRTHVKINCNRFLSSVL